MNPAAGYELKVGRGVLRGRRLFLRTGGCGRCLCSTGSSPSPRRNLSRIFRTGNQFYQRNRRGVSPPLADLDDPGIAARTILETWRDGVEQFADHRFIANDFQGLASGV